MNLLHTQAWLEEQYSTKHVHKIILNDLKSNPDLFNALRNGVLIMEQWVYEESAYDSKAKRKAALIDRYTDDEGVLDFMPLVELVVSTVIRANYTTINHIAASLLNITSLEKRQALDLACEVISMIADTDLYDVIKPRVLVMVQSRVELDQAVQDHIDQTGYIPPLVVKPRIVESNLDTAYYTYNKESLILGSKLNFHEEDICLDVINIQNKIPLALSMDFMACYEEPEPDHAAKALEDGKELLPEEIDLAHRNWIKYQKQCKFFTYLLDNFGNRIYLGNKVDKRGRLYATGYHISPQGNSYRKAIVELADAELIVVPEQYSNPSI